MFYWLVSPPVFAVAKGPGKASQAGLGAEGSAVRGTPCLMNQLLASIDTDEQPLSPQEQGREEPHLIEAPCSGDLSSPRKHGVAKYQHPIWVARTRLQEAASHPTSSMAHRESRVFPSRASLWPLAAQSSICFFFLPFSWFALGLFAKCLRLKMFPSPS